MYKYIIFDYDGTLVNSLSYWLKGYKQTLKQYGIKATNKQIVKKCFGVKNGVKNFGIIDCDKFYNLLLAKIDPKSAQYPPLFLGVKNTLQKLVNNKVKLAVLTSSDKNTVITDLKNKEVYNLFSIILGYQDVLELKPNPEGIYKIMDFYNDTNPKNYLFVGDSFKDLSAAKNAGVDFCLFKNYKNKIVDGLKIKDNTKGLTYTINRYSSLSKLVSNN